MPGPLNPDRLVSASPRNGYLVHAVYDHPGQRERMCLGNTLLRSNALCGVRGGDGWRVKPSYEDPDRFDWRDEYACKKCVRMFRKADDAWWAANSDPVPGDSLVLVAA